MKIITPTDKRVEFVELDAEWARLMLEHPEGRNRKWYPTRVERYRKIILRGDWKLNGETWKIRTDGSLGDGWHRCQALIEADKVRPGVTIPALMMWGATDEDIMTTDEGKPRGIHDVLRLEGFKWAPMLGAAITLLDTYENGYWKDPYSRTDNEALRDLFEQNLGLADWLEKGDAGHRATKLNRSALVVSLYVIDRDHGNHTRVKDFADKLVTGANLSEHHPVLALRDYGIRGSYRVPSSSRLSQKKCMTSIIKAFNFASRDKGIKQMRVLWSEDIPPVVKDR